MKVIKAKNVNEAWLVACQYVRGMGPAVQTRAGLARVSPVPVTTVYSRPTERVLLDPVRDANPFFHLFESLWMLAGRDDATWLDQFVSNYSERFAEAGGRQHGAYGKRWRNWFDSCPNHPAVNGKPKDQLDEVVCLLRANPDDRQAVLAMWDSSADLGVPGLKDRPCNTHAYLRVRQDGVSIADLAPKYVLDLTVCCRSNDVVWGCYGANAVHMSVLQEYLAARIGVGVGVYYQVSNNWHVYEDVIGRCDAKSAVQNFLRPYPGALPLVDDPESFDEELRKFLSCPEDGTVAYRNSFFGGTARPMFWTNMARKAGNLDGALEHANEIAAPDWRIACVEWLERRRK